MQGKAGQDQGSCDEGVKWQLWMVSIYEAYIYNCPRTDQPDANMHTNINISYELHMVSDHFSCGVGCCNAPDL